MLSQNRCSLHLSLSHLPSLALPTTQNLDKTHFPFCKSFLSRFALHVNPREIPWKHHACKRSCRPTHKQTPSERRRIQRDTSGPNRTASALMEGLAGPTIRFCRRRRGCCLRRALLSENGGGLCSQRMEEGFALREWRRCRWLIGNQMPGMLPRETYFETSAKHGFNVDDAFQCIAKNALKNEPEE